MTKKIKDTIHNYVYLTPLEEVITQHPLFLRLHYIHQNSFTYLTYPNSHNTRFSHSLGVMHLAGEILRSAIGKTSTSELKRFLQDVAAEFHKLEITISDPEVPNGQRAMTLKDVRTDLLRAEGTPENSLYNAFIRASALGTGGTQMDLTTLAVILFQSVRVAAMLHDVGHPPFSHIVEYALLEGMTHHRVSPVGNDPQSEPRTYEGHEHAGQQIASRILNGDFFRSHHLTARAPSFFAACAALTLRLLEKAEGGDDLLSGIKDTILSGDVDADRLDYVIRDGVSAGVALSYDIERLLDAAFLRQAENGRYEVAYYSSALATIENFFSARYDLYRWMIYHHDCTRRNLVVQRFIIDLLSTCNAGSQCDPMLTRLARHLTAMATGGTQGNYDNYDRFLDSYLLEMMWRIDEVVTRSLGQRDRFEAGLSFYLDIMLRRRNYLLKTLYKKPGDYAELAGACLPDSQSRSEHSNELISHLNELVLQKFREVVGASGDERLSKKENEGLAKYHFAKELERLINAALTPMIGASYDVKIFCYYLGTFRASLAPRFSLWNRDGAGVLHPIDIHAVSPTINMLDGAWAQAPQLMFFVRQPDSLIRLDRDEASRYMEYYREAVSKGLRNYLGIV